MARRKKNESQYAFGLAWFEQDDGSCIPQFAQTKTKDLAELEKFRAPLRGDSQDAVLPGTEEDISAVLLLQANIRQVCDKSEDFRSESLSNAKKAIMELRKRRSLVVPAAFPKTPGTKKTNRFRPVSKDGHVPTMSSLNDCSDEESSRMEIEESISENTRCEDTSVGSSKHNVSEDSSNKKVVKKTKNAPKKKPPTSNRPKRVTRASKQICSPYTEEKRPSKSRTTRNNATITRFTRASRQISSQHVQDAEEERPSKSISTNSKATRNNRASADEEAADVNSRGEERDETGSPKRAVGDTVSVDERVESISSPVANRKSNNVERADAGYSLNEDTSHSEESAETNTGLVCDNNGKSLEQTEGARDDMAVGSTEAASNNGEAGVPLPVRELITRHEAFIEQHHSDHCESSDDAVGSKHAGRSMADMVNSCMRKKPTIQLFKLKELSTPDRPITLTMEAFTSDDEDSDFVEKSNPAGPVKALQATPTGAIFQPVRRSLNLHLTPSPNQTQDSILSDMKESNNERSDDNLSMEEDSLADDKTETSTVCSSSAATILMEDVIEAMADADPGVRDGPCRSTRQRRSVLSALSSKAKDKTSDTDDSSETAASKRPKIVKPIRPPNSASRLRVPKPTLNVGRHKRAIDQVESSGFMSPGRPKKLIKCASPLCQQKAKRKAPQRKSRNTFLNRSTAASRSRRTPGTASPSVSRTRPGLFQFNPAVSMNRLTPSRPNNLPTGIQSFLKRHTPQKPKTFAEQQAEREEQLREKEAKEKEAKRKKEEEKQKELQERKQKKEEKRLRAAAQRLQREEEKQRQKVKKIEQWEKKVENADNVKVLRKKEKEAEGKILKKKQMDTAETARKGEEERTKKIKEQEQEKEKRLEEQKQQKEQEAAEKAAEKARREEADRARKQAEKEQAQAEEDRKTKLKKAAEANRQRQARLEKEENERKKKEENEKKKKEENERKRKVRAEIDKKNAEAAAIQQETTEREKEALRKQEDESERRQEEAKQRKEREEARRKKQEKAKAEQEERTRRREEEEAKRTEELRKKKEAMRKEAEKRREEERMEEKRKREEEKQKREEENQAKIQAANEKLKLLKEEQHKQKQLLIEMGQTSPNLNGTYNVSSYDMTPHVPKQFEPSTEENYNIADISSGDSTDDDEQPRKTVPKWAKGGQLRNSLIKQYYHVPKLSEIFVGLLGEPLDLADVFRGTKARYFKRTSSAVWNSPIRDIGHISFTEHCRPTNV